MPEGNYNSEVQKAFEDIIRFLSTLRRKIRGVGKQARMEKIMARARAAIDIEIQDNEGTPTAEKVDGMDLAQVEKALDECQNLCENAAFEVLRLGESGGKIQKMKKEFARMIEIAAKLR